MGEDEGEIVEPAEDLHPAGAQPETNVKKLCDTSVELRKTHTYTQFLHQLHRVK